MHSRSRSVALTAALLLSSLPAASCAQAVKSLGELSKLHAALVKEFGEKEVGVNLNNDIALTIRFINSPLNDKSHEERGKRAGQTAAFVVQRYAGINQIREIWVGFVRTETRYIIVNYSESFDFFGFDRTGRLISKPEEKPATRDSDDSLRVRAVYSAAQKQTEIIIPRLQLEGDLNYGLAVSPQFTVPGDATGIRRSSSPKSVSLNFASYSEKSMFPGKPKITVLADGKTVYETSAQFSTSKLPDGKFSEFLVLPIPYPAFRHMTTGKRLSIMMGDRAYDFTTEQVQALRKMTEYASE